MNKKKPIKSTKHLKKTAISKRSKSERSILIREADRVFSIYIRLRLAVNEIATCVTCGKKAHWLLMQNGHYIGRRKMATRWDEVNCNVQCPECNEELGGNLKAYRAYLVNLHGKEVIHELESLSSKIQKFTLVDIQKVIDKYNEKIALLPK